MSGDRLRITLFGPFELPEEEERKIVEEEISDGGAATFHGFTDEEQPEAAQWLENRFGEIEEDDSLPPAA